MPKVLIIAGVLILALGLVLGLALPALADSDEPLSWAEDFQIRIVKGTVTEVDEEYQEYFKIQSGEDEIGIRVDEDTRYFVLGAPGLLAPLAQNLREFRLHNQMRVRVQNQLLQPEDVPLLKPRLARWQWFRPFGGEAEFSDIEVGDRVVVWLDNGDSLAKWVLIIKPTTRVCVGGTITDISSSAIEITPDDGEAVTLDYNEDTVFVLNGFTSVEVRQLARAVYDSEHMMAKRVIVYLPD